MTRPLLFSGTPKLIRLLSIVLALRKLLSFCESASPPRLPTLDCLDCSRGDFKDTSKAFAGVSSCDTRLEPAELSSGRINVGMRVALLRRSTAGGSSTMGGADVALSSSRSFAVLNMLGGCCRADDELCGVACPP